MSSPTRDLTHVADTCHGFLEAYKADALFGEVTNIGINSEISIKDLTNMIARMMDTDITIKSSNERIRPENSEVERLVCDNSKLLMHTSWKQKYTLEHFDPIISCPRWGKTLFLALFSDSPYSKMGWVKNYDRGVNFHEFYEVFRVKLTIFTKF